MKRWMTLLSVLLLCLSLVACGNTEEPPAADVPAQAEPSTPTTASTAAPTPDKQAAVDAYNTLAQHFQDFADIRTAHADDFTEVETEFLATVEATVAKYSELPHGTVTATEAELANMVEMFTNLNSTLEDLTAAYQ